MAVVVVVASKKVRERYQPRHVAAAVNSEEEAVLGATKVREQQHLSPRHVAAEVNSEEVAVLGAR